MLRCQLWSHSIFDHVATISVKSNDSLGNLLPEFDTSFDSFGIVICLTFHDSFLASIRYALARDNNGVAYGNVIFNSLHTVAMLRKKWLSLSSIYQLSKK